MTFSRPTSPPHTHTHLPTLLPTPAAVYSLVKLGGVRNYIAVTWTDEDLQACADLNLPCADARNMLAAPIGEWQQHPQRCFAPTCVLRWRDGTPCWPAHAVNSHGNYSRHYFVVMTWIKAAVVLRSLQLGHAVMVAGAAAACQLPTPRFLFLPCPALR